MFFCPHFVAGLLPTVFNFINHMAIKLASLRCHLQSEHVWEVKTHLIALLEVLIRSYLDFVVCFSDSDGIYR